MAKSGGRKRRPQGCSLRSHRLRRLKPLTPTLSPATHSAMPSMLPCCTSDLKRRHKRIHQIWQEGNPFAWHLHLEAKLIYSSDGRDYLRDIGQPAQYSNGKVDCLKFVELFRRAHLSAQVDRLSIVFDCPLRGSKPSPSGEAKGRRSRRRRRCPMSGARSLADGARYFRGARRLVLQEGRRAGTEQRGGPGIAVDFQSTPIEPLAL